MQAVRHQEGARPADPSIAEIFEQAATETNQAIELLLRDLAGAARESVIFYEQREREAAAEAEEEARSNEDDVASGACWVGSCFFPPIRSSRSWGLVR